MNEAPISSKKKKSPGRASPTATAAPNARDSTEKRLTAFLLNPEVDFEFLKRLQTHNFLLTRQQFQLGLLHRDVRVVDFFRENEHKWRKRGMAI
jgi:hypothetical protein